MRVVLDNGDILTLKVDPAYPEVKLELNGKVANVMLLGRSYLTTLEGDRVATAETIEEIILDVQENKIAFHTAEEV